MIIFILLPLIIDSKYIHIATQSTSYVQKTPLITILFKVKYNRKRLTMYFLYEKK